MTHRIRTDRVVVVEGKYDEIKLSGIIDATIIKTEGFGIFKDKDKQQLLETLAEKRGLVILTDSDSAGFMIRNFLGSKIPADRITNVYIPDLYGKERRKNKPSAEGKLGVEGIPTDIIEEAFKKAGIGTDMETGAEETVSAEPVRTITNIDFYDDGIVGGKNSKSSRIELQRRLGLPERLSTSGLLKIINILVSYDEYKEIVTMIKRGE